MLAWAIENSDPDKLKEGAEAAKAARAAAGLETEVCDLIRPFYNKPQETSMAISSCRVHYDCDFWMMSLRVAILVQVDAEVAAEEDVQERKVKYEEKLKDHPEVGSYSVLHPQYADYAPGTT